MARTRRARSPVTPLQPAQPDTGSAGLVAAVLIAFAVTYVALQVNSLTRTSATWDEPGHLAAGYAALTQRDYRPALEHPPLARMWTALPLVLLGARIDVSALDHERPEAVAHPGPFEFGQRFLYRDNDADRLLYWARGMNVLVGLGLGVLVFFWAREMLGVAAAVFALAWMAFEPNLAAHSALATNDIGLTFLLFGTTYSLWRWSRRQHWRTLLPFVACAALTPFAKFSGLIVFPIVAVLLAALVRARTISVRQALMVVGLIASVAFAAAWLLYGLRYQPSAAAGWTFQLQHLPIVRDAVPNLAQAVGLVDHLGLLPNALTQGFLHGQSLVQQRTAFLAGRYSAQGWWYYFPAAIALKTPLACLLMAIVGTGAMLARPARTTGISRVFLLGPPVIFLAAAMSTTFNIGVRHVLPVFPFMVVLAAVGATSLAARLNLKQPVALLLVICALGIAEVARAYPSNLAFFNVVAGGPKGGYRYLADSNIDWGQDLKPLGRWMREHQVAHVNLAYFGTAVPGYYGIDSTLIWGTTIPGVAPDQIGAPKLPGYVAISTTLLQGVPFEPRLRDFYKPLRDRVPAADIGGSIKIYWVDAPWW